MQNQPGIKWVEYDRKQYFNALLPSALAPSLDPLPPRTGAERFAKSPKKKQKMNKPMSSASTDDVLIDLRVKYLKDTREKLDQAIRATIDKCNETLLESIDDWMLREHACTIGVIVHNECGQTFDAATLLPTRVRLVTLSAHQCATLNAAMRCVASGLQVSARRRHTCQL
jgi:hypothetical protein